VRWVGSALRDLKAFPREVQREMGQALFAAQCGETYPSVKALKGFPGASVLEIVTPFDTDAYRAVYTVQLGSAIYVLHAFQKKAKHGRKTPQRDMELIKSRLEEARRDFRRRQN
jgi:phage-related protein